VLSGRDLIGRAPAGHWGLDLGDVLQGAGELLPDRTWHDRGGYVAGFDRVFDADGFARSRSEILALDPIYHWLHHVCREALRDTGGTPVTEADLILATLAYPTPGYMRFAESVEWAHAKGAAEMGLGAKGTGAPMDVFTGGGLAAYTLESLGLRGAALALDAACASSLYALGVAAHRLERGLASHAIVAAATRADDLFLHMGFAALTALSRSGQCRPFDQAGDGLLPAEGAVALVLRRLDDALHDGDPIYGVIKSIGLSNDGRDGGFLKPSSTGQEAAIRRAYERIALPPESIGYLECHATGTPVGDRIELTTSARVFGRAEHLPLGSLKAQCGHLAAAAGLGGLLKVLEGLRAEQRPPSPRVVNALNEVRSPFTILKEASPWPRTDEPRRAAVSAFGFGGNNAHVVVEEAPGKKARPRTKRSSLAGTPLRVDVRAVEVHTGAHRDTAAFADHLVREPSEAPASLREIPIHSAGLKIPPKDLATWLPRDLLVLEAARRLAQGRTLPPRTAVLVGSSVSPDPVREGMRWRLREALPDTEMERPPSPEWIRSVKDSIAEPLLAARVTGTMPNMAANRIHSVLNLVGPGFTVFAEELSGLRALEIAAMLLETHEVDAAIVAAVDFATHPTLNAAKLGVALTPLEDAGDGVVAFLVERANESESAAIATVAIESGQTLRAYGPVPSVARWTGHAHSAQGLLDLAAEIVATDQGLLFEEGGLHLRTRPATEAPGRTAESAISTQQFSYRVHPASPRPQIPSRKGPVRAAVHASKTKSPEVALLFNGAAAAARGRGHEFLLSFPDTLIQVLARFPVLKRALPFLTRPGETLKPFEALQASLLLSQVHARFVLHDLKLSPQAVVGLSSGETNSLLALGAWDDLDALYDEMVESEMYGRHLSGDCAAAQHWLGGPEQPEFRWTPWRVVATVAQVSDCRRRHPDVHITAVHTPTDLLIAGPEAKVDAFLKELKPKGATPLGHEVVAHTKALTPFAEAWYRIHHRKTNPISGVRYYSQGTEGLCSYEREAVASALLHQALNPLNLPRKVLAAYEDGVRVFVECGPRDLMAQWVKEILGDREHLVVSMDPRGGMESLAKGLTELLDYGVALDIEAWNARVRPRPAPAPDAVLKLPATRPPIAIPPLVHASHGTPVPPSLPAFAAPLQLPVPTELRESERKRVAEQQPTARPVPVSPSVAAVAAHASAAPTHTHPKLAQLLSFQESVARAHGAFLTHQAEIARMVGVAAQTRSSGHAPVAAAPAPKVSPPVVAAPVSRHAAPLASPKEAVAEAAVAPMPASQRVASAKPAPVAAPEAAPRKIAPAAVTVAGHPDALRKEFPGPKFDREALYKMATGPLSVVLGDAFKILDPRKRVVRMPAPPFLLADRVLGIEGEQGSMKAQTKLWTETDVTEDAWYLNRGRMPFGIFIESGQADLLLISWLGADHEHPGNRVYRLLGCEVSFVGPLPKPGETIRYAIGISGFARHGAILMFFFHYDAMVGDEVRMRVRHGQAGFFTDEELAQTGGVLWDASTVDEPPRAEHEAYPVALPKATLNADDLRSISDGRPALAFGASHLACESHVATPSLQRGRMLLLDRVDAFDPAGGPWKRGYLRAVCEVPAHPWVYDGHFVGDPCMPGTLMVEAALQAMQVFFIGVGATLQRDGWRFEPAKGDGFKLRCRGQVIPGAKELVLEVFVRGFTGGSEPVLWADLLGTADGVKAFHAERMGLSLIPDAPLTTRHSALALAEAHAPTDAAPLGTREHLRAVAWGGPVDAFGAYYKTFEERRMTWPRLPGPPYLCLHRVVTCDAEAGVPRVGSRVVAAFDFDHDAWFFQESSGKDMPHGILLEAALQPCGWLASFVGCAKDAGREVVFRNLDGKAIAHRSIPAKRGTLLTESKLVRVSKLGATTMVAFEVRCRMDGELVYETDTIFGFFPKEDMTVSKGLPAGAAPPAADEAAAFHALRHPRPTTTGSLPGPMWSFVKEISIAKAAGGTLPLIIGRLPVSADQWWFKAHFYEDPVQPGSIGVEAMIQVVHAWYLSKSGADVSLKGRRLELAPGVPFTWRYRGQVLPDRGMVEVHAVIRSFDAQTLTAVADAWLAVDGLFIYEALGITLVAAEISDAEQAPLLQLDPSDPLLDHHRPTFTFPALPIMGMAELLAKGACDRSPGQRVIGMRDLKAHRWLKCSSKVPYRLLGEAIAYGVVEMRLFAGEDHEEQLVASATVLLGDGYDAGPLLPADFEANTDWSPFDYRKSYLFHGEAFQHVTAWRPEIANDEIVALLDTRPRGVPVGLLHATLLDAAIHPLPSESPESFGHGIPAGLLAYPLSIRKLDFHGPTPSEGTVVERVRFLRYEPGTPARSWTEITLYRGREAWVTMELEQVLVPKGPIGRAPTLLRRPFLTSERPVPAVSLSSHDGPATVLSPRAIIDSSWISGTIAAAYGLEQDPNANDAAIIALKDHGARALGVHPRWVEATPTGPNSFILAAPRSNLFETVPAKVTALAQGFRVESIGPLSFDRERLLAPWNADRRGPPDLVEDLLSTLGSSFLPRIIIENPDACRVLEGRGVMFLANHQTGVESLLFVIAARGFCGHTVEALAKAEHAHSWIGRLNAAVKSLKNRVPHDLLRLGERKSPAAMMAAMESALAKVASNERSLLVHGEGTRMRRAREPVTTLSSTLVDLAVSRNVPIVPVRFVGGLPVEELSERIEFPVGLGAQHVFIGNPLLPEHLKALPPDQRRRLTIGRINALGPPLDEEVPSPPSEALLQAMASLPGGHPDSVNDVILTLFRSLKAPTEETRQLLAALDAKRPLAAPWGDIFASL
jgi:acyl transferase domain-containing protein/3-hydroxymyristoyl/3-hydroxydecanoyl-(acyl carrier protein) dehydratase/1-acyl-sn-glycerol-3-phosphate acyltransferase